MRTDRDRLCELYNKAENKRRELHDKFMGLTPYSEPEGSELIREIDQLSKESMDLLDQIQDNGKQIIHYHSLYRRPDGWITGLFSRFLAPHPVGMKSYDINHSVIAGLPRYRLAPIVMLAFVVVSLVTMVSYWPWLAMSPFMLLTSLFFEAGSAAPSQILQGIVMGVVAVVLGLVMANPKGMKLFVYGAALREEQWFRSGAENWTSSQRLTSSVMFGLCHIVNLIYPIAILLLLMVAGAVLMRVYLAEHRRTNNTYMATMAATSFHATYNIYAFWFAITIVTASLIIP